MIPLNLYVAWREGPRSTCAGRAGSSGPRLAATPAGLALLWLIPERSLGVFVGVAAVLAAVVSLCRAVFHRGGPPTSARAR